MPQAFTQIVEACLARALAQRAWSSHAPTPNQADAYFRYWVHFKTNHSAISASFSL